MAGLDPAISIEAEGGGRVEPGRGGNRQFTT
jgi:hypothetical protein